MPGIHAFCRAARTAPFSLSAILLCALLLPAIPLSVSPLAAPAYAQLPGVTLQGDPDAREDTRQRLFAALAEASIFGHVFSVRFPSLPRQGTQLNRHDGGDQRAAAAR